METFVRRRVRPPRVTTFRLLPLIATAIAATLTTGMAAAVNPALVEPSAPTARVSAGGKASTAEVTVVATGPATTSAPMPSTTAAAAAPTTTRPPRPPSTTVPTTQAAQGGDVPPPSYFVPQPQECWAAPAAPAWTPSQAGLFLLAVDGSGAARQVVPGSLQPATAAFSPDGRTIAFESWKPNSEIVATEGYTNLYMVDSDGANLRRIAAEAFMPRHVSWSPDGRWLAFSDRDPVAQTTDFYLADAAGRVVRRLTTGGWATEMPPSWSPQSDRLAFAGNWDHGGAWVLDVATGALTKVFDPAAIAVSWSPDGRRLVVHVMVEGVVVVGAGGSSPPVMISATSRGATWSPTADEIAVNDHGVTLYRSDGTALRNLGGLVTNAAWAPDGRALLAAAQDQQVYLLDHEHCPRRLVAASTQLQASAAWAPDGRTALVRVTPRT